METLSRTAGVALLAIIALQGCSTNPSVSGGGTIQDFARGLDGQRYSFDLAGRVLTPSMSGALVTAQRIPKGLLVALAPAQERCGMDGGKSSFTDLEAVEPERFKWLPWGSQPQLPRRMLCLRGDAPLWSLEMQYGGVRTEAVNDPNFGPRTRMYLSMAMRTQLLTADQIAAGLRNAEAQAVEREKAAAGQRDRQPALEQERQQRSKDKEAEAQRTAALWPARVAAFQANLKVGDRFKWGRAPQWGGPFVGLVVRVEGPLAFVQFDNLTFSGQPTRYLPKAELEPFDGPPPTGRGAID